MYQTFAHTADVGLRVETPDRDALFAEAGRALFSLIVSNLEDVQARTTRNFEILGSDLEF